MCVFVYITASLRIGLCHKYLWSNLLIGLFQYMAKARYSMGGTSVSQLQYDPTGPCSDGP